VNARKLRFDLQTCFNNIFIEAEFRGNFSPSDVWSAFEADVDKKKFEEMIGEWDGLYQKIWKSLGFSNVRETYGEVSARLDRAGTVRKSVTISSGQLWFTRPLKLSRPRACHGGYRSGTNLDKESVRVRP
jgi:hypothetical protein